MSAIVNLDNGRPNNVSSFTTNSISPEDGSLLLIAIGNRLDSAPSNIPTPTGLVTWSEIYSEVHPTGGGANQGVRTTFYIGKVTGSPTGTISVSFGAQVQLDSSYSVEQITGADTRNNGLSAVIQTVPGYVTSTTSESLSLATLANEENMVYAAFYNGGGGATGGSGFNVLAIPPNAQLLTEYAVNNTSPSYSFNGPNASSGIAIEIGIAKSRGGFIFNIL